MSGAKGAAAESARVPRAVTGRGDAACRLPTPRTTEETYKALAIDLGSLRWAGDSDNHTRAIETLEFVVRNPLAFVDLHLALLLTLGLVQPEGRTSGPRVSYGWR